MTTRQLGIALLICWLGAFLTFLGACWSTYWLTLDGEAVLPIAALPMSAVSLALALLTGLTIIRAGRLGILFGLTVFVLGLAVLKLQG